MVDAMEQLLVVEPDKLDPDNLASTAKVSTNTSIVSTAIVSRYLPYGVHALVGAPST